jgi:hypothetical protein
MTQFRLYQSTTMPTISAGDNTAVSLGLQFRVSAPARLLAILWWQPTNNKATDDRTVALFSSSTGYTGTLVAGPQTQPVAGTGWQTVTLERPVLLSANTTYLATVFHPGGMYPAIGGYYTSAGGPGYGSGSGITTGVVTVPSNTTALNGRQNAYAYAPTLSFPTEEFNGTMYGVDILVDDDTSGGTAPVNPTPDMHVYDGTQWKGGFMYVYDGSQWVPGSPTVS